MLVILLSPERIYLRLGDFRAQTGLFLVGDSHSLIANLHTFAFAPGPIVHDNIPECTLTTHLS